MGDKMKKDKTQPSLMCVAKPVFTLFALIIPRLSYAGVFVDLSICRTTNGQVELIFSDKISMRKLLNGRVVKHIPYTNQEMNLYAWPERDDDKFDIFIHENIESPAYITSIFNISTKNTFRYSYTINDEIIVSNIFVAPSRFYGETASSCLIEIDH